MSRTHKLGAAALATILCLATPATVTPSPKDRPARATRHWEGQAVTEGGYFAWQQITRGKPNQADLFLEKPSGQVVKVNRSGTQATLGSIDDGTLVYQEFRGDPAVFGGNGFSRIVLYDLKTGKRTLPPRANGPDWEYWPHIRGPWLFFARLDHGGRHIVGYHRPSGTLSMPDSYVSYLQPGQINAGLFAWVSWEPGQGPARVKVFAMESSSVYELRSRRWQWAPSVGPQGAVYVLETGRKCGSSPVIKRYPPTMDGLAVEPTGKEILRLPEGFDSSSSYAFADPEGLTAVVHQRMKCGTKWGSDVYRFSDTVSLSVTKDGSGSGTVTGLDGGIDCGEDCAEVVSGGAWVTLDAEADVASHFAGWSEPCAASDEEEDTCTFRLDDALTINATFDLGP